VSAEPSVSAVEQPLVEVAAAPREVAWTLLVVGTGMVGTSVALAAGRRGAHVWLVDRDPAVALTAAQLGAGTAGWPSVDPDLVIVGAPPEAVGAVVADVQARYPTSVVTDVASVKAAPERDVVAAGGDLARYVGGHPLAGRERSGPQAARSDLFEGRPWVLTPSNRTNVDAVEAVRDLAVACGAVPVLMTPVDHDDSVALVSHVPHLVAAATAARLAGARSESVALAGQGIRDVTRIAASDPDLWVEILSANAAPVARVLEELRDDLTTTIDALAAVGTQGADPALARRAIRELLAQGNAGRAAIPGKHGGASDRYVNVPVVVPDEPGKLARLFAAADAAGVNVEDMTIEHSPGQPVGLVELAVRPGAAATLIEALRAGGWTVQD
jgi:prephenate dehydrogenase